MEMEMLSRVSDFGVQALVRMQMGLLDDAHELLQSAVDLWSERKGRHHPCGP